MKETEITLQVIAFSAQKSVFICVHLWFLFFPCLLTAGFRFNHARGMSDLTAMAPGTVAALSSGHAAPLALNGAPFTQGR